MNVHQSLPYAPLALYIGGRFIDDREGESVYNPANGGVLGHLPHATEQDLDLALESAARAFETWRWSSPLERSRILRRVAGLIRERADSIARDLTRDQGKPLAVRAGTTRPRGMACRGMPPHLRSGRSGAHGQRPAIRDPAAGGCLRGLHAVELSVQSVAPEDVCGARVRLHPGHQTGRRCAECGGRAGALV